MGLKDRKKIMKEVKEEVKENDKSKIQKGQEIKDYSKKVDKVYAQLKTGDSFIEILEDGYNLQDENKGYDSKVHINMAKLNKNDMHQEVFLSHYLDMKSLLGLRYLIQSGRLIELGEISKNKKSQYPEAVFSEFKRPKNNPKESSVFSIVPGMVEGNWMLNLAYSHDGKTERVVVPISTERLAAMVEFCYIAYIKHNLS